MKRAAPASLLWVHWTAARCCATSKSCPAPGWPFTGPEHAVAKHSYITLLLAPFNTPPSRAGHPPGTERPQAAGRMF